MACKATWQRDADPREHLCGVDVAQTRGRATQAHADARVAPRGMRSDMLAIDGPTGIVGPGESIRAITQRLRGALPFICDNPH